MPGISSETRALESLPGGYHVAWFWEVVARDGEGISAADFDMHVISSGVSAHLGQVGLASPALLASSLKSSVFAGATRGQRASYVDGRVVTSFRTAAGLHLDAHFVLESDNDHRITMVALRLEGGASTTAIGVAAARAAHYTLDEPKILPDTLAEALTGEFAAACIARVRADSSAVLARHYVAARSRWAEDTLAAARTDGVDQYVLLGAGLDSFAYRRPTTGDGLRIFEVDRPISQAWKRRRLGDIGVEVPQSVAFVPIDFESDDLDVELSKAGFDAERPSVVAWLGVTYYLTSEAIGATVDRVARWSVGTRLVFDYCLPEPLWDTFENWNGHFQRTAAALVAASGEPLVSFFAPEQIDVLLRARGYDAIEHLDHNRVRTIFMAGHAAGPPGPLPWYRVVRATVLANRP
jgi:methyltransferase (TIGR00027 family)